MSKLRPEWERLTKASGDINRGLPVTLFFTDTGLQAGSNETAVDGSVTPVDFFVAPPLGLAFRLQIINIMVGDKGGPSRTGYGNISSGVVVNGSQIWVELNPEPGRIDLDAPFIQNDDFVVRSQAFDVKEFAANERTIAFRDLLATYSNTGIINGNRGEKLGITINDNLSTLLTQKIVAKGVLIPAGFAE